MVDVGSAYPVSAPSESMPESAGRVVSGDAEVELVLASSAVGPLAVPDAAGTVKLPAEVVGNRAEAVKSEAKPEVV